MDAKIYMGKPERHYFYMPWEGEFPAIGEKLVFINPRTKAESSGSVTHHFTEHWISISDIFCEDHFNVNSATLRRNLQENYPQFREREVIRFIRLKS